MKIKRNEVCRAEVKGPASTLAKFHDEEPMETEVMLPSTLAESALSSAFSTSASSSALCRQPWHRPWSRHQFRH